MSEISVTEEIESLAEESEIEVSSEPINPFSLTDEYEFKSHEVVAAEQSPPIREVFPVEYPLTERVPALPGTPESEFRKCPCIGVMPGRACPRCNCSKWVKTCPKCKGEMTRNAKVRNGGHARTERCGFCMGIGQLPARLSEVRAAEEEARAYTPSVAQEEPIRRRGAQLPGTRMSSAERKAQKAAEVKSKNVKRKYGRA